MTAAAAAAGRLALITLDPFRHLFAVVTEPEAFNQRALDPEKDDRSRHCCRRCWLGGWLGYQLAELLPFLPFWLAYPPPILAGIALTWPYQGRLVYVQVALWFDLQDLASPSPYQISCFTHACLYSGSSPVASPTIVALYTNAVPNSISPHTAAICSFSMRDFGSVNRASNI